VRKLAAFIETRKFLVQTIYLSQTVLSYKSPSVPLRRVQTRFFQFPVSTSQTTKQKHRNSDWECVSKSPVPTNRTKWISLSTAIEQRDTKSWNWFAGPLYNEGILSVGYAPLKVSENSIAQVQHLMFKDSR